MKKFNQKLILNRQTIAHLNVEEMRNSLAGRLAMVKADVTIFDKSCPMHCPIATTTDPKARVQAGAFLIPW